LNNELEPVRGIFRYQIIISVLAFGSGKSYGIEFFMKKNLGKLTGWASYTLSKTTEKFSELNYGKEFPFTYDRRHNLSITSIYQLSKNWTFSADFTLYSGIAFTLPGGKIFEKEWVFSVYNLYSR
jgi:hypothetical protein